VRPGIFGLCFAPALAVAGAIWATPSHAYTADQQQLCTGDAFRLCSSEIPNVDRVTACMVQNQDSLSPGCAQFFRRPVVRATPVELRKPVKARKAKRLNRES
jgi:hypothetical protein